MTRIRWLGLALFVAAVLIAASLYFFNLSSPQSNATLNVILQSLSIGVAVAALALTTVSEASRRRSQTRGGQPKERTAFPEDAMTGEPYPEPESFQTYVSQLRAYLESLGAAEDRFVTLATAADPEPVIRTIEPKLEWLSRNGETAYAKAERRPIDLFDVPEHKRVVLLGDPGAGKSTCLQQIALRQLASAQQARAADATVVLPIYASLSEWSDRSTSATEFLQAQLARLVGGRRNYYVANFSNLLANGRFLLLLDGLNEVPGRQATEQEGAHETGQAAGPTPQRPLGAVSIDPRERSVRELATTTGLNSTFVLSCRSHEYFDSMSWQVVRVLPMSAAQIDQFVAMYTDEVTAVEIRHTLRSRPALAEIATNPFFLRSIIRVLEQGAPPRRGVDPDSRGGVLDALCEELVDRERRRQPAAPDMAAVARIVGKLAYRMLANGRIGSQTPLPQADAKTRDVLRLLVGTGLLIERDGETYVRHQIVQEYFAARALCERVVRRRPATLLANRRFTEVVALWFDLDQDRMLRRLRRCLRARNLPWRRPRFPFGGRFYVRYSILTSILAVFVLVIYALDFILWPIRFFSLPLGFLPFPVVYFVIAAVATLPLVGCFVYHSKVISNTGYVLGLARVPSAIDDIVRAFGRVSDLDKKAMAQSLTRFGPVATQHAVRGLHSRHREVRIGCVLALGEAVRQDPQDALANEALVRLPSTQDRDLVPALAQALVWCVDDRRTDAITTLLDLAGRSGFTNLSRLGPLSDVAPISQSALDERMLERFANIVESNRPPQVRAMALTVIGALQVPGYEDRLATVLADPDEQPIVRKAAAVGLAHAQTESAIRQLIEIGSANPGISEAAGSAVRTVTNSTALLAALDGQPGPSPVIRAAIAIALGSLPGEEPLTALRKLAVDPAEDVRLASARALALANRSAAVPVLGVLARDEVRKVRLVAIGLLSDYYPDLAPAQLLPLATDHDYKDRVAVIQKLAHCSQPKVQYELRELTGEVDRSIREAATAALAISRSAGTTASPQPRDSWLRHPVRRLLKNVDAWFGFDTIRDLWRLEKLTGAPWAEGYSRVMTKIYGDAELAMRCRHLTTLFGNSVLALLVLFELLVAVTLRGALWATEGLLVFWYIVVPFVVVAGLTLIPRIEGLRDAPVIGTLVATVRWLSGTVVVVGLIGGVAFTWWIWALLIFGATLVYYMVNARSNPGTHKRVVAVSQEAEATARIQPAQNEVPS